LNKLILIASQADILLLFPQIFGF